MISYFLGICVGSHKKWGSPTQHFWCCHGTLIQANASYEQQIFMEDKEGVAVCQWLPSEVHMKLVDTAIAITLKQDGQYGVYPLNNWYVTGMTAITKIDMPPIPVHRPDRFKYSLTITCDKDAEFTLKLRVPRWVKDEPIIYVNGVQLSDPVRPQSFIGIRKTWSNGDIVQIEFPKLLTTEPLPGSEDMVAFMDGAIVLAGLIEREHRLIGNPRSPETMLVADRERNHSWWNVSYYRTKGQDIGIRFIPLYEIKDETYSIYFPVDQVHK